MAESAGVLCPLGVPLELPLARCSLGRSGSSVLLAELLEGLVDEPLLAVSAVEVGGRDLGLLLSLPLDVPAGTLAELPAESIVKGCDVS